MAKVPPTCSLADGLARYALKCRQRVWTLMTTMVDVQKFSLNRNYDEAGGRFSASSKYTRNAFSANEKSQENCRKEREEEK